MEGTAGCFGGQTNKKCIPQADSLSPTHNHTYAWMELDQVWTKQGLLPLGVALATFHNPAQFLLVPSLLLYRSVRSGGWMCL